MSVRKSHNAGRNHLRNVTEYYQQIGHEKAQSVIDSITASYTAEGLPQPNPMLSQPGAAGPFPPMGFPGRLIESPAEHALTIIGMPPPPFGAPPGQPGMLPPGGRGMPFPPFNPQGGPPPNLPQGLPFPPQGFPPNFPQQFPPGGFNPGQQGGPPGPPGSGFGHPGQSQSPSGGFNAGPPPGVGMGRR